MKLQIGGTPGHLAWPAALLFALVLPLAACTKSINVDNSAKDMSGASGGEGSNPDDVSDDTLAISGTIVDAETDAPIKSALVSALSSQVLTNGQGQYLFDAAGLPGLEGEVGSTLRITASKSGYQQEYASVLVKSGHNRNVDMLMMRGAETHRILLAPSSLTFTAEDFMAGDTATHSLAVRIDSTGEEMGEYHVTIATEDAAWLSVGDGQDSGTASSLGDANVDFTVDKANLTASTQTNVTIAVGASTKQLLVKVTLP